MKPEDWISTGTALYKTDFEQHNFGGAELDVADPAWDLASAIFEFRLSSTCEQQLLRRYREKTGDFEIEQRLLLYKLLYAACTMRAARYWITRQITDEQRVHWNEICLAAQDFATFQVARHAGSVLPHQPARWTSRLFFLDLDGVFDWPFLGFPHPSPNGIRTLQILSEAHFSVVLHTARPLAHVKEYCRAYHLPGGVAELGSVFWDAITDREIPLVSPLALAELRQLRETLQTLGSVSTDPGHKYSIRAYRFEHGRTKPLTSSEAEQALRQAGCNRLTFTQTTSHTCFVEKGCDKGAAIGKVKSSIGLPVRFVAAIGDSNHDLAMLLAADQAYAPANASRGVRELIAAGKCRKMRRQLQSGLLDAAQELSQNSPKASRPKPTHLLDVLLGVSDRPLISRILGICRWQQL
jgi:hydroxymethylpyrimidine pyrophosphatase-like HAD family hydrolase